MQQDANTFTQAAGDRDLARAHQGYSGPADSAGRDSRKDGIKILGNGKDSAGDIFGLQLIALYY